MTNLNVIQADISYVGPDGYSRVSMVLDCGNNEKEIKYFYLDLDGSLAPTGGSYDSESPLELALYKAFSELKSCFSCDKMIPIELANDVPQGYFCESCSNDKERF
tara:strand:- start:5469 stop:5783 length:315 start_codon:yes stop_codon:yes gene_type:complete